MTVQELIESGRFKLINEGDNTQQKITKPFCCDLLSFAMGNAPAGCAWCTVMGNMNTLAVASLTEAGCVILCEGAAADEIMLSKAAVQGITLLSTQEPIFESALWIYERINEKA